MRHRKGRSALTATGIVLGVAIFFGVLVSNATTARGFDRVLETFTGRTDVFVQPVGVDADLDAAVVARARSLPGVRAASAGVLFYGGVAPPGDAAVRPEARRSVLIQGVDIAAERAFLDFVPASGRFPAPRAPELLVSEALVPPLRLGGEAVVAGPRGLRTLAVVGVLRKQGAGRTNDGNVAFTSIDTARDLAGKGPVFSNVALILDPDVRPADWIRRHRDALGPSAELQDAAALSRGFRDFLRVLGSFFVFFAVTTLFVGAFLIYLTLSMAVIERTRMYGTMRALGAGRAQIRRVVLTEALALGAISTVAGLGFGLALARGLLALIARLFDIDLSGLTVTPGAVIAAIVVGLSTTLVSSLIPAVRAGRLSPVEAMRGAHDLQTRLPRSWTAGAGLLVAGVAGHLIAGDSGPVAGLATLAILLGSILLVPLLLRPLARLLGRVTERLAPGVGDVAVLHLSKERSRSAYTLGLIMVVMAMLFGVGGLYASVGGAIDRAIDRQFGGDLIVFSGPIDPEVEAGLRATKGVARVSAVRNGRGVLAGVAGEDRNLRIRIIDPATYFEISSFPWTDGSDDAAREALARGGAILMQDRHADRLGVRRGGSLTVSTPLGDRAFTVAGTYASLGGPPQIVMGLADGTTHLGAVRPTSFLVDVHASADPDDVHQAIERGVGARYPITVQTAADEKGEARDELNQYFTIISAILLVAAIVGLLGLANTLAMSVLQRYREIGILRAIGVTRGQVRRMVLVESATMALAAFVLSLPLGWLLSAMVVRTSGRAFGFSMTYVYPAAWVPAVAAFGVIVAVIAALTPGRRAARLEVVGALQYE